MDERYKKAVKEFWDDYYDDNLFDVGDLLNRGGSIIGYLTRRVRALELELEEKHE